MAQAQQQSQVVPARKAYFVTKGNSVIFLDNEKVRQHIHEGDEVSGIDQNDLKAFIAQGVIEQKLIEV